MIASDGRKYSKKKKLEQEDDDKNFANYSKNSLLKFAADKSSLK